MASGRILKTNKGKLHLKIPKVYLLGIIVSGLLMAGCGTAGNVRKNPLPSPPEKTEKKEPAISEELSNTLNEQRSELDDAFNKSNEVPAYFLKKESTSNNRRNIGNPYTGFRVQIISTRSKAKAKRIAQNFRDWAAKHVIGYAPDAYLTFDQPYYRVQVGNFQFQRRATNFTQMIKSKYPGAWVVHDRIKPEETPEQSFRVVK